MLEQQYQLGLEGLHQDLPQALTLTLPLPPTPYLYPYPLLPTAYPYPSPLLPTAYPLPLPPTPTPTPAQIKCDLEFKGRRLQLRPVRRMRASP